MAGVVPVRDFTSPEEMKAHYAALHRKCFAPRNATATPLARPAEALSKTWTAPTVVQRERLAVRTAAQTAGNAKLSLVDCLRISALVADITMAELTGPRRRSNLTRARQIFSWLAKHYTGATLSQIGQRLGGRDHTTSLHGVRRVEAVIEQGLVHVTDDAFVLAQALWAAPWPSAAAVRPPNARTQLIERARNGRFAAKGQP